MAVDRRRFIHLTTLGLLAAAGCGRSESASGGRGEAAVQSPAESQTPAGQQTGPKPKPPSPGRPRVVLVRSKDWLKSPKLESLREGLARGVRELTGVENAADAWRSLFEARENIALKVNCLAGPALCSSPALVSALVDELAAAGHPRKRLWIYDRTTAELDECGFEVSRADDAVKCMGTDEVGYEQDVTVTGSVGTQFSLIISAWADAIVNIPVAKDHDLAGISGALKNHLGSINNPNKLHFPDISLAIADVAMAPVITGKQRLVVYDLLRVCYDGGPAYKPGTTKPYGAIMLSRDPVAADAVVAQIIDDLRAAAGLPSLWQRDAKPQHIKIAADDDHQLGCAHLNKIDLVEVEV